MLIYHLNATPPTKATYAHSPTVLSGQHSQGQEQVDLGLQEGCEALVGAAAAAASSALDALTVSFEGFLQPHDDRMTQGLRLLENVLPFIRSPQSEATAPSAMAMLFSKAEYCKLVYWSLFYAKRHKRFDKFLEGLTLKELTVLLQTFTQHSTDGMKREFKDSLVRDLPFFWARKEGSSSAFFATQDNFIDINTLTKDDPVVRKMQMILAHKFPGDALYVHREHLEEVAQKFCQKYTDDYKTLGEIDWTKNDPNQHDRVFGLKPNSYILVTPQALQDHKVEIETVSKECPDVTFTIHCKNKVLMQGFDLPATDSTFVLTGNVKEIGILAFENKTLGSKLDLSNVKTIEKGVFLGATFKKGLKLADGVVIEERVFERATFEEDVDLSNVKTIKRLSFQYAQFKKGLKFAKGTTIDEYAFLNATFPDNHLDQTHLKFTDVTIHHKAFGDLPEGKVIKLVFKDAILKFTKDGMRQITTLTPAPLEENANFSNKTFEVVLDLSTWRNSKIRQGTFTGSTFHKLLILPFGVVIEQGAFHGARFSDDQDSVSQALGSSGSSFVQRVFRSIKFAKNTKVEQGAFEGVKYFPDIVEQTHLNVSDVTIHHKAFGDLPEGKVIKLVFKDAILEFTKDGMKRITKD
ncbi:MAG: leucine-rich repeat protein [Alphaproteobacteria bacterium]|nr:MAG: leucine-rich repeat protein [Alphaproteobacteria bacterium]